MTERCGGSGVRVRSGTIDRRTQRGWCIECGMAVPVVRVLDEAVLAGHSVVAPGAALGAGVMAPPLRAPLRIVPRRARG